MGVAPLFYIGKKFQNGMISATGVKPTLIKFVLSLILTTVISSCLNPSDQTFDPHKRVPGEPIGEGSVTNFRPKPDDVVQPTLLPNIGKWMLDPDLTPAHWIGEVYYGKTLREPINIIIVDQVANSPEEAKKRLIEACSAAGYPSREGHSSGYLGYIGGRLYAQLPEGQDHAFSNAPYFINNDHGRLFGPYSHQGAYLFIGALSREKVVPWAKIKHQFVSFNQARDDFAENISRKTEYQVSGYVNLSNVIVNDPKITTGDHDGIAVSLKAGK